MSDISTKRISQTDSARSNLTLIAKIHLRLDMIGVLQEVNAVSLNIGRKRNRIDRAVKLCSAQQKTALDVLAVRGLETIDQTDVPRIADTDNVVCGRDHSALLIKVEVLVALEKLVDLVLVDLVFANSELTGRADVVVMAVLQNQSQVLLDFALIVVVIQQVLKGPVITEIVVAGLNGLLTNELLTQIDALVFKIFIITRIWL